MLEARVLGVGLWGPGLIGWQAGRLVLSGAAPLVEEECLPPLSDLLSPRERRRLSPTVRLALSVAEEAVSAAAVEPQHLASVFGWPHGDGVVVQGILEELATPQRYVSPKDFHHSVHNVAAGYWAIATGSHRPCSSVAAAIDTFSASLLKALVQLVDDEGPVLLVVCDSPFLEPLNSVCPVGAPFGVGFVLAPNEGASGVAGLRLRYEACAARNPRLPRNHRLRALWALNSAVRAVPLLETLANRTPEILEIPYGIASQLVLEIEPC